MAMKHRLIYYQATECLHFAGSGMIARSLDSTHKTRVVVRGQKFAVCTHDIFSNSSTNKKGLVYVVV